MNLNSKKNALFLTAALMVLSGSAPCAIATAAPEVAVMQQSKEISGTVLDPNGEPVVGAYVIQKGTTNGTITDMDGKFTIKGVEEGTELEFSFVGFETITVAATPGMIVKMQELVLDDVVVVGYGVQKKKLVTGATVEVKGDDIAKLNTTNVLGALQSQTPGVQITQSTGQAGDGFKVNIRGLGTVGNSAPLYVIDGVAGGDINSLNPSDIERIDVLKDAASSAIYGARAANGVILITTKQGKSGKMSVSYDGYVGWQYLYKKPDALNAKEFMYAQELKAFNGGNAAADWSKVLPEELYDSIENGTWKGTDWIDESYNEGAMLQNHAVNITGGNDVSKFSMGVAYTDQNGIFGGDIAQSEYKRFTARLNSDHVLYKSNRGFDMITMGETLTFNNTKRGGVATGNMYWNHVHELLVANPLMPVYTADGNLYDNAAMASDGWNVGQAANPMVYLDATSRGLNISRSYNLNTSVYLQIQPIENLKLKTQYGYKMGASSYRSMTRTYSTGSNSATQDEASQQMSIWSNLSWENTISYSFNIAENNNFDVVIGNSIEQNRYGENLNASAKNNLFGGDWDRAYVSNAKPTDINDISVGGSPSGDSSLASFFGRLSYNYAEKYMAQVTLRADGSSNFMKGNRWGVFPSASLGWVVTNESFMSNTQSVLDFLKLRGSWGQNGNCSIDNFQYLTTFSFDLSNGYYFGENNKLSQTTGGYANILKNEDVTWETSQQIDLGLDARFLNSRLSFNIDWYKKTTKDWLLRAPILSVYGLNAPYVNGGDVENTGIELGIGWNDHIGEFTYGVNANMSYNKNEVTKIANAEGVIHGPSSVLCQQEEEVFRAKVGEPIGYFWGMKTEGVFQNQKQIDDWFKNNGIIADEIHGTVEPGDLIYVDMDGDHKITKSDKTNIGDPHPDVNLGVSLNLGWKAIDFSITGAGAFGQQILRTAGNTESAVENLNKKIVYGSWKGEGTSNKLPKLNTLNDGNWITMSDMWLEDADYFKFQNITLGYDFKKQFTNIPLQQIRLYVTAQNLFTISDYSGMDPEIGTSGGNDDGYSWGAGVDNGFYPSPRTFIVGVNVKF